jgi:hypothetical protein
VARLADGHPTLEDGAADASSYGESSELLSPGETTLNSVLEILDDPNFVDACISPETVETGVLETLSAKASRTLQTFINEEITRRIAAGLYKRDESYRPGEPYVTHGKANEFLNYQMDQNEVKLVELSRSEYPWLYELQEDITALQSEISARRQRANSVAADESRMK